MEFVEQGFASAKVYRLKELQRWIRRAESKPAANWRVAHFLKQAAEYAAYCPPSQSVCETLASFERQLPRILHRWYSLHTNAWLERLNGLLHKTEVRATGCRRLDNFIVMLYLIVGPILVVVAS